MPIVALDIGGTKIEGVLFSDDLQPEKKLRIPTEADKPRAMILKNIEGVIEDLRGKNSYPIGIAMAGWPPKDFGNPNIPSLIGFNLERHLKKKYKKLAIENDGHCFALAEAMMGAAAGKQNVVGVILGTGVGGGAIIDGKLLGGRDHAAAHIGHMIIDPNTKEQCRCGQFGDFEAWAAGPHIVSRYKRAGGKLLDKLATPLFYTKEPLAKKIVQETYEHIGMGFANLIALYNPEAIVLGGGVSNLPIVEGIRTATKKYATIGIERGVEIVRNKLGDSAGVYGAAILAQQLK